MKKHIYLLIAILVLGGCEPPTQGGIVQELPSEVAVGLGYGFLDKEVEIFINGSVVLSMVGTQEIEDHAQLLGPKIVASVKINGNLADVQVSVDGIMSENYLLKLEEGRIIEINNHPIYGLEVRNIKVLIQE
jgi:hypothetical protein